MQATVIRVEVAVGDAVEVGRALVVLEAMKMEQALLADRAGTVTAVDAVVGATVAPGELLVEIDPGRAEAVPVPSGT
jgi:acetyl-CoA/propionyl-CoA carboxylase biotin carboxyl carrier protein